jgi:hypothetical protein
MAAAPARWRLHALCCCVTLHTSFFSSEPALLRGMLGAPLLISLPDV